MAVVTTPVAAATYENLRTRARTMAGDGDSASNQKFTDAQIFEVITDMMAEMQLERQLGDPASYSTNTNLTYTANTEFVDLSGASEALQASNIYRVEDITNGQYPREVRYVAPFIVERHRTGERRTAPFEAGLLQYTLVYNQIAYRPLDGGDRTLRIWYLPAHPAAVSGGGEQHPFMPGHEELIVLGAVRRLQEIDDEVPFAREKRYGELWDKFVVHSRKLAGVPKVNRVRIYR